MLKSISHFVGDLDFGEVFQGGLGSLRRSLFRPSVWGGKPVSLVFSLVSRYSLKPLKFWIVAAKRLVFCVKARERHCHKSLKIDWTHFVFVSINIQRIPNIEYHESSNSCPDCDIERVMEVVADARKGDPEGQAQQARLRRN